MTFSKIIIGKYLLIALIVAIIIFIFMIHPTINSEMSKKWIVFAVSGIVGFVATIALLILGEAFMNKSSSISKLIGGNHHQPRNIDNLFGNMSKVNDLFG